MPVKTIAKTNFRKLELGEAVAYMAQSIAEMSQRIADSQADAEAKMAKSKAEMDAKIAEFKAETDAKIAKSKAEMDVKIAKSKVETDAKIARSDAKIAESQAKTDRAIQKLTESQSETSRAIDRLTANIDRLTARVDEVLTGFGTIGKRFGELVELIVIPGVRHEMNAHGHSFKYAKANKKFYAVRRGRKEKITEVDLFLHNGTETMAAEVKATLSLEDVRNHLTQLKTLRKHEVETDLRGKKLYGALIGVFIDYAAREYALENGLYVLEILEQEQKLKADIPKKRHVW